MFSTVTDKGQITLPKALREALSIAPGSRVEFTLQPGGIARMRVLPRGSAGLFGLLAQPGEAVRPLEALDDAVAQKVQERHPAR